MNPFKVITVYARLYADCLRKSARGIAKSPWTLLLPIGMSYLAVFGEQVLLPLDGGRGILFSLALDFVFSAYLYFVAETVSLATVRLNEFGRAFLHYFWPVVGASFVVWITWWAIGPTLRAMPNGVIITLGLYAIEFVLLSAIPEVLYQRSTSGLGSIGLSIQFIQENWIEWFVPHALLVGVIWFVARPVLITAINGDIFSFAHMSVPAGIIFGAPFHIFMVFRGHLFETLSASSHRQRMFRYRGNA